MSGAQNRIPESIKQRIIALRKEGLSWSALMERFRVEKEQLNKILHKQKRRRK